jgi:flagellar basal-body rod protein FlgB
MADITGLSFGSTIDTLGNALTGAAMQNSQIANNIANANTPGYHRAQVTFKDALAAAVDGAPADDGGLALATDDERQFAIGQAQAPVPFDPQPQVDDTMKMRTDGSNVDVDREMAELSENSGYQQTMAQLMQTQFGRLRQAITEQAK